MASIQVQNNSDVKVLFSVFKKGDAGIPFSTQWIDPKSSHSMEIGNFKEVGVGAQTQEGGRWVSDPRVGQTFTANQTCVLTISKTVG
ncbi:hypothetical protein [uncultured Kordia sp.]|uniref:hypothetical protein n=1 Tax=uncultured Kordia sp. TaxID=507699 RepID=UPI00262389D2|nr:hypothetical protein [uncultured Kordia sp.]